MSQFERSPSKQPRPSEGWVYILTNASMPGLVKIGFTTRNPTERIAELSRPTGVATPFVLACDPQAVSDCAYVEKAVHRMLADKRVSLDREFFRCSVKQAVQVIEAAAGSALGPRYRPQPRQDRGRRVSRSGRASRRKGLVGYLAWYIALNPFRAAIIFCILAGTVLAVLKPNLPALLPASVIRAAIAVESMHH